MTIRSVFELPWVSIIVSTLVAGTVLGLLFHVQLFILPFFGSLIGIPTATGGVIVHSVGSVFFIALFAGLLTRTRVRRVVTNPWRVIGAGLVYGVVLFIGVFGLVLPILAFVRPVRTLSIPYLPIDALLLHLVFGLLLGLSFAFTWKVNVEDVS